MSAHPTPPWLWPALSTPARNATSTAERCWGANLWLADLRDRYQVPSLAPADPGLVRFRHALSVAVTIRRDGRGEADAAPACVAC